MKKFLRLRRKRDELGWSRSSRPCWHVVLLMFAAYAVDIGMQINRKHQLNDTLDAAAQAGAYNLPGNSLTAKADALAFALAHDPTETGSLKPNVDFWCVVASKLTSGVYQPDSTQMPSTCYPGTAPYTAGVNYKSTGKKVSCSTKLCAIPCVEPVSNTGTPKIACNTIRVFQGRAVDFAFAPAGGIQEGTTGNVISVACKGSCGTIAPNPMDVAIIADRTSQHGGPTSTKLVNGIKGMLQEMTPSQQYVALGTIGRSAQTTTALAASKACDRRSDGSDLRAAPPVAAPPVSGCRSRSPTTTKPHRARCRPQHPGQGRGLHRHRHQSDAYQGTTLAAPMKAAAKYLLGLTANNLGSLPERTPSPRKVLIFETDGQPNERQPTAGDASLSSGDVFSNPLSTKLPVNTTQSDTSATVESGTAPNIVRTTTITHHKTVASTFNGGNNACTNLINVAANAKAQGILVIMIGYNCSDGRQAAATTTTASSTTTRTSTAPPPPGTASSTPRPGNGGRARGELPHAVSRVPCSQRHQEVPDDLPDHDDHDRDGGQQLRRPSST